MSKPITRRDFVKAGTAASVAAAVPASSAFGQAPTVLVRRTTPPVVISSANGHEYRNGGPRTCVEEAFSRISRGEDVLDAILAGVNLVELDPEDTSVGYGGLPNADGVVQLDSCCMHGPRKRAGGVAEIEGVKTPSLVARAVADLTDHHLIVGQGASHVVRRELRLRDQGGLAQPALQSPFGQEQYKDNDEIRAQWFNRFPKECQEQHGRCENNFSPEQPIWRCVAKLIQQNRGQGRNKQSNCPGCDK